LMLYGHWEIEDAAVWCVMDIGR